ncbi:UPF0193 protein EVG1 like protein [Eufriesea mexicana]|uniref:UPF0193 protein EVG1 like protein n=1 Tax=Eufriesea mexicana TaxID=516756 RepID=A0A310S5D4_9HYME|nr:PREDICTED: UPF0193 protein EVG1-like [Eufriesea mexicana]OAD52657.1 UPF0193 protein EVG1 like protein [Eufriesea mexicana]
MDRKYQKVEMGVGAFHHPPRAKYSEETKNLIKLLMEESKVSMMKRKTIQEAINRGEPLPVVENSKVESNKHNLQYQVLIPTAWKKRSQDMIIKSGAYEREQYRRTSPLRNKEKQKRHLACMMAYGKDMPETPHGPRILHKARREPRNSDTNDSIDDLVRGIKERMEFLNDMECLGMDKKYRPIIQQEVAHKLRLIESVDKQRSKEIRKDIRKLEKPLPKPFPLGQLDEN